MEARASQLVWWPNLKDHIERRRAACECYTRYAPSQASLPPIPPPRPDYPMQQICSDFAHRAGFTYIVKVDRFSNWPSIYQVKKASGFIKALQHHFITHGSSEEISTNGGPEYTAIGTQEFLELWNIKHRLSSAHHPHSNFRAEHVVKVIKRRTRERRGA